ncbi:nectin-2-like isoform X3 [Anarrhichthys ocellatus]|uniref:nectin-2-like isoform X3 n=1 Tax=Anarrhichthys ocellatus TaxID=433405 RepID=UPI0012EDCFA8|nr:nectin-2-like isoform X3 [Anarrhichthys ocellatus]
METCSKSPFTLLKVIFITLLPVLEAQVKVTGYLGHDVTLPCQFIPGPNDSISQVQWELEQPDGKKINIIVSNSVYGVNVSESFLKERVEIKEQSLIIRDVEMRDAGSYICSIAVFPRGSFEGTTNLHVQVIMAAIVYLIFIRRCDPTVRQRVYIDTDGPVTDVARPSVLIRDEDVVYSDVKLKRSRHSALSSNEKHTADDVTYSEVLILRQQPKYDEMYTQVKRSAKKTPTT